MNEKVCLVTGANRGLGKATAAALARRDVQVIMACRDQALGNIARADIVSATANNKAEVMLLDLSSQESIRKFVGEYNNRFDRLDVLINVAGVYQTKRVLTGDGLEAMFAINHLGPFLLTQLLLDKLKASAPARVLLVTAPSTSSLNFEDLQASQKFNSFQAFGASKMANLLYTYDLARKLEGSGITVNAIHPGLMKTDLMKESPPLMRWFLHMISRPPGKAAANLANLALSSEAAGATGKLFTDHKIIESNAHSHDPEIQNRLWDVSVRLTQQRY